eukprot:5992879-Amphidinium_carterae.1
MNWVVGTQERTRTSSHAIVVLVSLLTQLLAWQAVALAANADNMVSGTLVLHAMKACIMMTPSRLIPSMGIKGRIIRFHQCAKFGMNT